MNRIRERVFFSGFSDVEEIKAEEYIIINNNDFEALKDITSICNVLILNNVNMSSHFANVIRKKMNQKKYRFIFGGEKLCALLKNNINFVIEINENSIIVGTEKYVFQAFDSYESLKYDIDFNLKTYAYCVRPYRKYEQAYLRIMKKGFEGFHGRKCFIHNDQVWYVGGLFPSELFVWCDQHFEEYLSQIQKNMHVFQKFFTYNSDAGDISYKDLSIELCEYYKSTDYIGSLVEVVGHKVLENCSPEQFFALQSCSSCLFTIKDDPQKALEIVFKLKEILKSEKILKQFFESLCQKKLQRIEYWFMLLNVLSDIRRKSMQVVCEKYDFIENMRRS